MFSEAPQVDQRVNLSAQPQAISKDDFREGSNRVPSLKLR